MGSLCSKESAPDAFAQPGRTVSSLPPSTTPTTSAVPKKVGGPPRTLGGNAAPASQTAQDDARRKAAEAAEARANSANAKPKGKLGAQLYEQKKQTRNDTLVGASQDELRRRDADTNAESRAYN